MASVAYREDATVALSRDAQNAADIGAGESSARKQALLAGAGGGAAIESFSIECSAAPTKQIPSRRLFVAVLICCLSPVLMGFSIGFTSPVQASMEGTPKGGDLGVYPPPALSVFSPGEFTLYAAILNVGAVPGAFAGSVAMDRLGRRRALAVSACPHLLAWCYTAATSSPVLLQLLRMLTGFGVGMGAAVAPSYIGEIATAGLRGPLGTMVQLSATLGLLAVNVAGTATPVVQEVDGETFSNWRRLSMWGATLATVLATAAWMPESPKWLAQQGRPEDARLALRRLRAGDSEAEALELMGATAEMSGAKGESSAASTASGSATSDGNKRRLSDYPLSLVVAVGLLAFQQLSGVNAIMMYTTDICAKAGMQDAQLSTLAVMVSQVALTALSSVLVDLAGRRSLMQVGALLMGVAHVGLSYYMAAVEHGWWAPSWLALAALGIFIIGFSTGMGPVPWMILGEVVPVEFVGTASALATSMAWSCAFFVCIAFRGLQAMLGASGVFALFGAFCFGNFAFVCALVPETKGKTLDEVLDLLRAQARSLKLRSHSEVDDDEAPSKSFQSVV